MASLETPKGLTLLQLKVWSVSHHTNATLSVHLGDQRFSYNAAHWALIPRNDVWRHLSVISVPCSSGCHIWKKDPKRP